MPKAKAKGRSKRPTSTGPANRARSVPRGAPEMEEFEEGKYPQKASRLHSEEDAGLESGGPSRAAT